MTSTLETCTSSTRPAAPAAGDTLFETDTKNIITYDGSAWSGYNNDGFALGANGYSLDLDGTDDRVELGTVSILNSASQFSITCWIKLSSSASVPAKIFETDGAIYGGVSIYQSTQFDFIVGVSPTAYSGQRLVRDLGDDTWHHVACTYGSSTAKIYIDSVLASTTLVGVAMPSSTTSTAGTSAHIGSNITDGHNFQGKLDDLAIFNAALTAAEVSNIYTSRIYNSAKLEHFYKFENDYTDSEGSLNGTLQGNPIFDSSDKPY